MKHLLPWRVKYDETGGYDCMTSAYVIYDAKNERITEIDTGTNGPNDEARQTAEFIVIACNNHEELTALVNEVFDWPRKDMDWALRARRLLAKIEKG